MRHLALGYSCFPEYCDMSDHTIPSEITTYVHIELLPYADLSSNLSEKLSDMRTIRCIAGFFSRRPESLFHRKATEQSVFYSDRLSTLSLVYRPDKGVTHLKTMRLI